MARARLSAAAVKASGNRRHLTKAELAEREASEAYVMPGAPSPPDWLPVDAAERFEGLAKSLAEASIVAPVDADALARYVVEEMRYESLSARYADASKAGDVDEMAPLARLMDAAFKNARAQGNDLGLSPSARTHVAGAGRPQEKNRFSDLGGGP